MKSMKSVQYVDLWNLKLDFVFQLSLQNYFDNTWENISQSTFKKGTLLAFYTCEKYF